MNNPFHRNRERVAELIYGMKEFTESELIRQLHNGNGAQNLAIGGGQTIRDYLKELAQLGILRDEHGVYKVIK